VAVSKFDLAAVAVLALMLLWIEHDHRIIISTPAAAEVAPKPASACPESDAVPFSADCLALIGAGSPAVAAPRPHAASPAVAMPRDAHARLADASPCPPSNENAPYSAACIRFLSGWYWQPDAAVGVP
jgi:hypothetical protein